ncbi:alpha/beta hydrolase [Asticcacaulis sp. AC460]|uniref:alpha/beta hydrolase n=1 Tax=Asticcacaulis sp. AC460 TaxID=1282360 RepID=UPI0003C3B2E7|nr:alpha/beta hydrolase [Asticcacaulis sp. AC460]ESQ86774.1 alpha/beta hydrolase [Asticcacaulis sp. AC460]
MSLTKRSFLAVGLGAFLAGCNTLSLFNRFTPKDSGVRRVAHDVAFGDDPRQRYDVYAPAGKTNLPVLVFFYGGGWNSGSKDDYAWMGYALASIGYVVAVPDYRLVPEFLYPVFLEDNAAAVKHILAHAADYGGDSARLGTIGQSAGGYAAVMMALDPRYLPESTVKACVGIAGPYDFYPFDVPASINAFGKWAKPEETQPITYARKVATKFLLLQSRADKVVGTHNAVNLDKKLRDAGTDVTLKLYDGLSHQDTAAVYSVPFRKKGTLFEDTRTFLSSVL